jgi:hypothetical protein
MDAMVLSREASDPSISKTLIREAYTWLQRYFDAEDQAMAQLERLAAR